MGAGRLQAFPVPLTGLLPWMLYLQERQWLVTAPSFLGSLNLFCSTLHIWERKESARDRDNACEAM